MAALSALADACVGEYTVSYVVGLSVFVNLLLQWVYWEIKGANQPQTHERRRWWNWWKRRGDSGDR